MSIFVIIGLLSVSGLALGINYLDNLELPEAEEAEPVPPPQVGGEETLVDLLDMVTLDDAEETADTVDPTDTTTQPDLPTVDTADVIDDVTIEAIVSATQDIDDTNAVTMASDQTEFEGSDGRDHVTGNDLDTPINTYGARDVVYAGDGDDLIDTGAGNDLVFAGAGNDSVTGGSGNDRIFMNEGEDVYSPILSNLQDGGDDFVRGGDGADQLIDSRGSNTLRGDLGRDLLVSIDQPDESSADTLFGGYGADRLFGDDGDEMNGGHGTDAFYVTRLDDAFSNPVTITDFDAATESLTVVVNDPAQADAQVSLLYDASSEVVRAYLGENEVTVLQGLAAEDIPNITTNVMLLQDLLAA